MGGVYEAVHIRLPQRFAVKVLLREVLSNPDMYARFRREAEIASALRHSNVVQVIDFAQTPAGEPFMVMEFLDGETLAARLRTIGMMSVVQAVRLGAEVASALSATHAVGVIHRDLKPQNVFLCKQNQRDDFAKVVDFGISKIRGSQTVVTREAQVLGTPHYMSPEQALGRAGTVDHRTDIFALGTILYECLTGIIAFDAESLPSVLFHVVHHTPPPVRSLRPDVPEEVEDIVGRAMAKMPDARFQTMGEMAECLERTLRHLTSQTGEWSDSSPRLSVQALNAPRAGSAALAAGTPRPVPAYPALPSMPPAPYHTPSHITPPPVASPPQTTPLPASSGIESQPFLLLPPEAVVAPAGASRLTPMPLGQGERAPGFGITQTTLQGAVGPRAGGGAQRRTLIVGVVGAVAGVAAAVGVMFVLGMRTRGSSHGDETNPPAAVAGQIAPTTTAAAVATAPGVARPGSAPLSGKSGVGSSPASVGQAGTGGLAMGTGLPAASGAPGATGQTPAASPGLPAGRAVKPVAGETGEQAPAGTLPPASSTPRPTGAPAAVVAPLPQRARIELDLSPRAARVLLNGVEARPPLLLPVSPARHLLRVEADGYKPEERPLVASRDMTVRIQLKRKSTVREGQPRPGPKVPSRSKDEPAEDL